MFRKVIRKTDQVTRVTGVFLIKLYQNTISPWTANSCRFHPSCSAYAKEAIQTRGALLGLYFTLRRLLRCHPFHPGGFDPVPKKRDEPHGH